MISRAQRSTLWWPIEKGGCDVGSMDMDMDSYTNIDTDVWYDIGQKIRMQT